MDDMLPLPAEKSAQLPSGLVHSFGSDSKTPSPEVVHPTLRSLEKSPLTRRLELHADDCAGAAEVEAVIVEGGVVVVVVLEKPTRDNVIVVVLVEKIVVVEKRVSVVVGSVSSESDEIDCDRKDWPSNFKLGDLSLHRDAIVEWAARPKTRKRSNVFILC